MWYDVPDTAIIICSSLQGGQSSMMRASENGHEEVVRILLSAGANVDLQDLVSSTIPAQGHVVTCTRMYSYTSPQFHVLCKVAIPGGTCTCSHWQKSFLTN